MRRGRGSRRRSNGRVLGITAAVVAALVVAGAIAAVVLARQTSPIPRKAPTAAQIAASKIPTSLPDVPPPSDLTTKPLPATETVTPAALPVKAYRGLASWVDIYDRAWSNPAAAVADMAKRGVKTLFIETGNSRSSTTIFQPTQLAKFIAEAHAHKMAVVAWYLPDMTNQSLDYSRIEAAIKFETPDGQRFDSFALDIESHAVTSESARNSRLSALSAKIRTLVGEKYPLGAIIPSPVGLSRPNGGWTTFPYAMLASTYDVFVPMGYYTYHTKGASGVYADATANVRILRSKPGCAKTPIHMIGGIAENSSLPEVRAFVRAVRDSGCVGASLYSWVGTTSGHWQALATVQ